MAQRVVWKGRGGRWLMKAHGWGGRGWRTSRTKSYPLALLLPELRLVNDGSAHQVRTWRSHLQVLGIPDGFKGFDSQNHPARPRPLPRSAVDGIDLLGGTVLGTSK